MEIKVYRNWNIKKAKDLYTYCSGISKGAKYFGTGFPYLTFTEIFHNYFVPDTLTNLVQSNDKERKNCSIKRGDVFLTRTSETDNELGMSCVALKDYPNATFNGFSKRLRPINNEILPEYAGFYFRSPIFRAAVTSMSSIITRASLNEKMLDRLPVVLPPLSVQQKIANILSRYDGAIENNNKRIKLLEQMAQNLYKEWFVRFRFPGWQNAEFENGMPKGWKVDKLGNLFKRLPFGKTYKKEDLEENGKIIVIDQSTDDYLGFHNEEPSHKASFDSPLILFGDHSCKFVLMTKNFSLGENIIPISSCNINPYYLFRAIDGIIETTEYKRHWSMLITQKILIPTDSLQTRFSKIYKSFIKQIENLKSANQNLAKQRDLLLPRLMSGKLEV